MAESRRNQRTTRAARCINLEQLLGFSGIRSLAMNRSQGQVLIGAGYAWRVDSQIPPACLTFCRREPEPGFCFDPTALHAHGALAPGSIRETRNLKDRRVAEILQRIIDGSLPSTKSAGQRLADDESVAEHGKRIQVKAKIRRLTAEPPQQILESIVSKMLICDILMFDLTDYGRFLRGLSQEVTPNSNVLLEIGVAMGINVARREQGLPVTPVFLVQLDHDDCKTPSDLNGLCVHRYRLRDQPSQRAGQQFVVEFPCVLQSTLREAIRAAVLSLTSGRRA